MAMRLIYSSRFCFSQDIGKANSLYSGESSLYFHELEDKEKYYRYLLWQTMLTMK